MALVDLVTWVELGVKLAHELALDPAVVAAADYGCQSFATGMHLLPAACPQQTTE